MYEEVQFTTLSSEVQVPNSTMIAAISWVDSNHVHIWLQEAILLLYYYYIKLFIANKQFQGLHASYQLAIVHVIIIANLKIMAAN